MASSRKSVLITSASGNIGKKLVPLLLSENDSKIHKLVLPTQDAARLKSTTLSSVQGDGAVSLAIEEGTIRDPVWFQSLLTKHNVDTVFLCVTGPDEMYIALNCLDAIDKSGTVKRVVYQSIMGDFVSDEGAKIFMRERAYPHVFAKFVTEQKLLYGRYSFDWTVLGASWFFANFEKFQEPLLQHNLLPGPMVEKGICAISMQDIALAVRNAMFDTSGKFSRKKVMLGSKHAYMGDDMLQIWSSALNKKLDTYWADQAGLDRFEKELRGMMPGDFGKMLGRNLRLLYEYLVRNGLYISDEDYQLQFELLEKEPDDLEKWTKETASLWMQKSS